MQLKGVSKEKRYLRAGSIEMNMQIDRYSFPTASLTNYHKHSVLTHSVAYYLNSSGGPKFYNRGGDRVVSFWSQAGFLVPISAPVAVRAMPPTSQEVT